MTTEERDAPSTTDSPSRLAAASHLFANTAFWPGVAGVVGVQIDLLPPIVGFAGYVLTLLLGLLTLGTAIPSFIIARRQGDSASQEAVKVGFVTGGLIVFIGAASIFPGSSAPPINDITTNYEDPPEFLAVRAAEGLEAPSMLYPPEFIPIAREHYPDLKTTELRVPIYVAIYRSVRAARALGWTVVAESAKLGIVEAQATSHIFRFVDDISIRVRETTPGSGTSLVDVRSRSRNGRGDLGANAQRIRIFLEKL